MIDFTSKIEFDLTIKQYAPKNKYYYDAPHQGEPELEVKSELNFKSLSAIEVLRKLLDYLHD